MTAATYPASGKSVLSSAKSKKAATKRMSISLSEDAYETLQSLAELQGISLNEAIRRAIATESYIRDELKKGSQVLVQKPSKAIHQLVFR